MAHIHLDDMLEPQAAAAWLKMSRSDLMKKIRAGIIPAFRLGHKTLRVHPRTIIAKLAMDAGVNREAIEASFSERSIAQKGGR